jgi:hypothetical protein
LSSQFYLIHPNLPSSSTVNTVLPLATDVLEKESGASGPVLKRQVESQLAVRASVLFVDNASHFWDGSLSFCRTGISTTPPP